jgi:hypothetical protein
MLERRLQIQHRIPSKDKERGFGHNHFNLNGGDEGLTEKSLQQFYRSNLAKIDPLWPLLEKINA